MPELDTKVMRHGFRILLVDDHPSVRRVIDLQLRELGYKHIDQAADGYAALAMLGNNDYDLVLVDSALPGISAFQFLQALRAGRPSAGPGVLMVTADAGRERMIKAAKAGLDGFILKPFASAELKTRIERVCARRAQAA